MSSKIAAGANQQIRPALVLEPSLWVAWVDTNGCPNVGNGTLSYTFTGSTTTFSPDVTCFVSQDSNTYVVVTWTTSSGSVQVATLEVMQNKLKQAQAPTSITGASAVGGPSVACFGSQIVVAFRPSADALALTWVTVPSTGGDLPAFPSPTAIAGTPGSSAPSLAAAGSTLYLAWTYPAPVSPATTPPTGAMGLMQTSSLPPSFAASAAWYTSSASGQPVSDSANLHPVLGSQGSALVATLIQSGKPNSYLCVADPSLVNADRSMVDKGKMEHWIDTPACTQSYTWPVSGIGGCVLQVASGTGAGQEESEEATLQLVGVSVDSSGNVDQTVEAPPSNWTVT